ncbi:hypothetical protein BD779DRAFT_1536733, partial [Infundibulicybe gibba]
MFSLAAPFLPSILHDTLQAMYINNHYVSISPYTQTYHSFTSVSLNKLFGFHSPFYRFPGAPNTRIFKFEISITFLRGSI